MFDTVKTAKNIKEKRMAKNMTQTELADAMGVSFQAVSNWERGNSMPDIGKLSDLAKVLGCSVDELLSSERESRIVREYTETGSFSDASALADAAPAMKPDETKSALDRMIENAAEITPRQVAELAPFLDDNTLNALADRICGGSMRDIVALAPFLSGEKLSRLAREAAGKGDINDVVALCPFLESVDVAAIAKGLLTDMADIVKIAPFLDDKDLASLIDTNDIKKLVPLAPFLDDAALDAAAKAALLNGKESELSGLYPFLSKETLAEIAGELVKKGGYGALSDIAPFLG